MAALIRLAIVASIAAVVLYLINRVIHTYAAGQREQPRSAPICPRCESARNVMANAGSNRRFPQERCRWYCRSCEEGF